MCGNSLVDSFRDGVENGIVKILQKVSNKAVSANSTFDELGLDSLAYIEAQLEIENFYGISLDELIEESRKSDFSYYRNLTPKKIANYLVGKLIEEISKIYHSKVH